MKKFVFVILAFFLSACGVRDTDPYGLSGNWNRGDKEIFEIKGRHGRSIAKDGTFAYIELAYDDAGGVKVKQKNISIDYLANFVPRVVAENIYTNRSVKETYFLIRKVEEDKLFVMVHGWQAFYSIENQIYYVVPYLKDEVWTRVEKKNKDAQ